MLQNTGGKAEMDFVCEIQRAYCFKVTFMYLYNGFSKVKMQKNRYFNSLKFS